MVEYIKIDDEKYPFKFGMRSFFNLMNSEDIEFLDEVQVNMSYDAFLQLAEDASKTGARKDGSDELVLTQAELEDAIDEDPQIFIELQEAFKRSKVVEKMQNIEGRTEKKSKKSAKKK